MAGNQEQAIYNSSPLVAVPSQPINLTPQNSIFGTQIQRAQTNQQPLVVKPTPLNVQRVKNFTTGNYDYFVQFFANPQLTNYTGTTVYLNGSTGTQSLSGVSGKGPIRFSASATAAPASISAQSNTATGSSSTTFGNGNSRYIPRQ